MSFADIMAKKMQKTIEKNISKKTLTLENMEDFLKELRVILLEADVNFRVAKALIDEIRQAAKGEFIKEGVERDKLLLKIVHEQFTRILGINSQDLSLATKPSVIMVAGLQGSGKTTTTAKLAHYITKKLHKRCLLVACDTFRLAAVEQLKTLGSQLQLEVFYENNKSPELIAFNACKYAEKVGFDVVLIDTAGRLHIDENLMKELQVIQKQVHPDETLLVVDGMAGQDMINVANTFIEKIAVMGFVITKMDGSARGGIALSLSYLTKLPIKFIGEGEKINDLELFHPKRMADRILGMGDVDSLVEKVQGNFSSRDLEATMNRMMVGQFDLNDLLNQMKQVQKMGKLGTLAKMIPGLSAKLSDSKLNDTENDFKITEIIINSTTAKEREKPQLLRYPGRKKRVLAGSGRNEKELNKMLSQFDKTRKMMDQVAAQIKAGKIPEFPGMEALLQKNT